MSVLLFKIEDLNFIVHNFGAENRKTLLLQIARFLDRISKGNVYYYNSGTFVIMTADEYGRRIESCVRAIQDRFHMQWKIGNAKFFVNYKMMSFSMPEDVRDLNTFYCCNSEFSSMIPDKDHIIDIHDIDFNQIDRKNLHRKNYQTCHRRRSFSGILSANLFYGKRQNYFCGSTAAPD